MLEEFGDKVDAATKGKIEEKLKAVEEARVSGEPTAINAKIEELNKAMQEIGSKIYQEAAAKQQSAGEEKTPKSDNGGDDENVVDAKFKEK